MQLDKFILLGHSLGGFLAASYAIHYPDRYITSSSWNLLGMEMEMTGISVSKYIT
jgi:pimeloyl-ACP methyl ester carboxylesterase